jgi:hypothetical protein
MLASLGDTRAGPFVPYADECAAITGRIDAMRQSSAQGQ